MPQRIVISTRKRRLYRFSGYIEKPITWNIERTFFAVSSLIFYWAKDKFSSGDIIFPDSLSSFLKESPNIFIGIIYDENGVFTIRTSHPDVNIAGRTWITEAEVQIKGERLVFAARNSCSFLETTNAPFPEVGVPGFFFAIMNNYKLFDALRLSTYTPFTVKSEDDLNNLYNVIIDKERILPVIVISEQNSPRRLNYQCFPDYFISSDELCKRIGAYSHIVRLSALWTNEWSELVGSNWGVYDGAVRIYYPSLDFSSSDYYQHPLFIKDRIIATTWITDNGQELTAENAFFHRIINRILYYNSIERDIWSRYQIKFYFDRHSERLATRTKSEIEDQYIERQLFEEQISALQSQITEFKISGEEFYQTALEMQEKYEEQKARYNKLRIAYESLKDNFENIKGSSVDNDIIIPDNYLEMADWVEKYLTGRLVLHNRAINMLKTAEYVDVALVYRSLLLLANEYRNMRLGYPEASEKYNSARDILNLDDSRAITDESAGEQGDTYYVRYNGKQTKLRYHLRKGNSRQSRFCLRIYFFWDDENEIVVVGSLPSHLATSSS